MKDITVIDNSKTSLMDGKPLSPPKSHVIITFSNIHYFITQQQYDKLMELSSGGQKIEGIDIDGNYVKFSNISDIPLIEKYRESFPEKSSDTHQPYSQQLEDTKPRFSGDALEKLIEVLEKDYKKNPTPKRRVQLLKLKETKRVRDITLDKKKKLV